MVTANRLEDKLFVYHKQAHIEMMLAKPEECVRIASEGFSLVEHVPIDELGMEAGYYYIELLHRQAESNRDLGNYEIAIAYARKAVALEGRFYIPYTPRQEVWGWSEYHLARALYMSGNLDESEVSINHAKDLFEEIGDQWSISNCYELLGQIQMQRQNFDKALALNQQAFDILLPRLGYEHREIASNLVWRGNILRAKGDEQQAVSCYQQAIEIYRKQNLIMRVKNTQELLDASLTQKDT